ncbi:MAG: hypothetical protein R2709_07470 [Marmoricola sp.]
MAIGFEKMQPGSLATSFDDREQPLGNHIQLLAGDLRSQILPAPWMFALRVESTWSSSGPLLSISRRSGRRITVIPVNNPYAQFQDEYTLEQIMESPEIYSPLTKLQCSPTSDGSGAVVLASEAKCRAVWLGRASSRDR